MTVTLNYSDLAGIVDRQLSTVGKRSTDDQGNLLFKDITLGSREKELIDDFIRQAVIDLSAETAAFITEGSDTGLTLTFPTNHNAKLDTFIEQSCKAYCVSFVLWSWFTITAPRIAGRYQDDCKRQLSAVIRLIHDKKAPEAAAGVSPVDISTNVTNS